MNDNLTIKIVWLGIWKEPHTYVIYDVFMTANAGGYKTRNRRNQRNRRNRRNP